MIPNNRLFQILSSLAFGILASSIFSLIAFKSEETLEKWVLTTSWVIFSVSLIAGIGLLILDKLQKDMLTYSSDDVLTEMNEIEKSFDKPELDE